MANDIIIQLDDETAQGLTIDKAVDKMRGPVNTKIKLTIIRKGSDKSIEVTIVRDIIRVKSVARIQKVATSVRLLRSTFVSYAPELRTSSWQALSAPH